MRQSFRSIRTFCVASLAFLTLASFAQAAPIAIDTFQTGFVAAGGTLILPSGKAPGFANGVSSVDTGPGILGTRTGTYYNVGAGNTVLAGSASIGGGQVGFSNGPGERAALALSYAFGSQVNFVGQTPTIAVQNFNPLVGTSVSTNLTLTSASGSATQTIITSTQVVAGVPSTILTFGNLVPTGSFDLSKVTGAILIFEPAGLSAVASFGGNGGFKTNETPVPEPTTLAIFGVMAIGGYAVSRRRRQQVA